MPEVNHTLEAGEALRGVDVTTGELSLTDALEITSVNSYYVGVTPNARGVTTAPGPTSEPSVAWANTLQASPDKFIGAADIYVAVNAEKTAAGNDFAQYQQRNGNVVAEGIRVGTSNTFGYFNGSDELGGTTRWIVADDGTEDSYGLEPGTTIDFNYAVDDFFEFHQCVSLEDNKFLHLADSSPPELYRESDLAPFGFEGGFSVSAATLSGTLTEDCGIQFDDQFGYFRTDSEVYKWDHDNRVMDWTATISDTGTTMTCVVPGKDIVYVGTDLGWESFSQSGGLNEESDTTVGPAERSLTLILASEASGLASDILVVPQSDGQGAANGCVQAFIPTIPSTEWTTNFDDPVENACIYSSASELIYVSTAGTPGDLVALDPVDGSVQWTASGVTTGIDPLILNDAIYTAEDNVLKRLQ